MDPKSKKKYQLTLGKGKDEIRSNPDYSNYRDNKKFGIPMPKTCDKTVESEDSQNFMLRLSESFGVDDTHEDTKSDKGIMQKYEKDEVIVISDSSEDGSPKKFDFTKNKKFPSLYGDAKKSATTPTSVYTVQSSDSDFEEEIFSRRKGKLKDAENAICDFQGEIINKRTRELKVAENAMRDLVKKTNQNCNKNLHSSDEIVSETDSGETNYNDVNVYAESNKTPTVGIIGQENERIISTTERLRRIFSENGCNVNTPGSAKSTMETNLRIPGTKRTPISAKISSRTTVLSKKETRDILKVIKSKRIVHDSPRQWKRPKDSDDSDAEESKNSLLESEMENEKKQKPRNAVIIDETDSEDEVIQGSRVDLTKPSKTHVQRFLHPAITEDPYSSVSGLSVTKNREISKWLMMNSADCTNDSSISNVSASNKNSPSSGNSSLERLELNYETPNNRAKFNKIETGEKSTNPPNSTRSYKSVRQTTIDNFIRESGDGTKKMYTPISTVVRKKQDFVTPAAKGVVDGKGIMDCADILDNLYGNVWRAQADHVLPVSEPRKENVKREDKGVQTERKAKPKTKKILQKSSESSSREDDFDKFLRNTSSNSNSTKKPTKKTNRRKYSFINDSSSSDSQCESTYLTALTHPRISNNNEITNRPKPISPSMQRLMDLCDSDTDDEIDKRQINNRRKLSFSDDESETSTSEYDPHDVIPPKSSTKVFDALKTPRDILSTRKAPHSVPNARIGRSKSFLTSLSATVPLIEAHPEARKYRQNFKNTKEDLCKYLYKLYNENIFDKKLPHDMSIEWNVRMRGTAGFCYNRRSVKALSGVTRSSRIVLATKILDTPDRLRDTLVHEMCHAAAWLINNVSDGHGPFWKGWASKAMKTFPELPAIKRCHDYKIATKFTYRCTGCGYSIGRHSKSLNIEKKRCGHCYGKFELLINKVSKSGTVQQQTPTSRQPTAFALFVKENYQSVKKDRKGVAHKEVMQILGQQFSAIKISKKNDKYGDKNDENNPNNVSFDR